MNYQQTLEFLYNTLPMFSHVGAVAIKKDITNTQKICEALNNPQTKFKSIHIAGTNGKGSASHILAAILQTAEYKTGLYTSPHLKDFRERIKVNGIMCDEEFVIDFVKKVQPLIYQIQPSFFEITVAMALEYFAQQKVDVAVIETGLGGRLDSTNIIVPEISFITNIGYDHMNLLGDSLDKIAFEKAGIIKQNIPVVVGEYLHETKPVFEKVAQQKNAPLIFAQENFNVIDFCNNGNYLHITMEELKTGQVNKYKLDLTGIYQTKNILGVIAVVKQLQQNGWNIDEQSVCAALQKVKTLTGLHGRWEIIQQNPVVVLDVAHNVDGFHQILEQLKISTYNHLHIILGMVKDKDVNSVLKLLPQQAKYYFTQSHIARALHAEHLMQMAESFGLKGNIFNDVNIALAAAKQQADESDLILICGSVFLVAEVN